MKIKGPELAYTDLLDFYLDQDDVKEWQKREAGVIERNPLRPSSAGRCEKALYYDLMEYRGKDFYPKEGFPPNVRRLLNFGHYVEEHCQSMFNKVLELNRRYSQQVVSIMKIDRGDLGFDLVEGSLDDVFILSMDGKEYKGIMDYKSSKDGWSSHFSSRWQQNLNKFKEMETVLTISDKGNAFYTPDIKAFIEELGWEDFLVDNILQLNIYACNDFCKDRGIDHAFLYKYNKNTSEHYELRWEPCEELANYVKDKFQFVSDAVDNDGEVDRPYTLGSLRCAYCNRKKQCWGEDVDAVKAWWSTLPPKKWPDAMSEEVRAEVEALVKKWEGCDKAEQEKKKVEREIVSLLQQHEIKRIKTTAGKVYDIKFLKSNGGSFVLRKGKV